MTTILTDIGWTGLSNGVWTDASDTVTDNVGGIVNHAGITANTLDGKDSVTGSRGVDPSALGGTPLAGLGPLYFGIENLGTIIMGKGQDSITGTAIGIDPAYRVYGIYNEIGSKIAMGDGNHDSLTGIATGDGNLIPSFPIAGIYNRSGVITMGNGDHDSITGTGTATGTSGFASGIFNRQGGVIAMGDGNQDSITGIGGFYNGIYNRGTITMGNGNQDSITGTGLSNGSYGIYNQDLAALSNSPTITLGDGNKDSIIGTATGTTGNGGIGIYNKGHSTITMGNGNQDSIIGTATGDEGIGILNEILSTITMGNGNKDSIIGTATGMMSIGIKNLGNSTITMGDGNDTITASGTQYGIYNSGTIQLGDGNDTITANGGFGGDGTLILGSGKDTVIGFGAQTIKGGGGKDTLIVPSGSYKVGINLGSQLETLTANNVTMSISGFTNLRVGANPYKFSQLTNNQVLMG